MPVSKMRELAHYYKNINLALLLTQLIGEPCLFGNEAALKTLFAMEKLTQP